MCNLFVFTQITNDKYIVLFQQLEVIIKRKDRVKLDMKRQQNKEYHKSAACFAYSNVNPFKVICYYPPVKATDWQKL